MNYLPYSSEIIVLPIGMKDVRERVILATKPVLKKSQKTFLKTSDNDSYLFNGQVDGDQFTISRRIRQPENFLPLVTGIIEPTTFGSIVFLKYRLFFSTNLFLGFWSVLTFLLTLFFLIAYNRYLYAALSFGFGLSNYFIAMANFNIQIKKTQQVFHGLCKGL